MASLTLVSGKPASASGRAWTRLRRNRLAWLSGGTVVTLLVLGVFGPSVLGYSPGMISNDVLQPPSSAHWLGTDELGRDVLTLLIYGIRTSLVVGVVAALSVAIIGTLIGALAGFAGGRIDSIIMRVSEGFQIIPTFILAAVIVALAGAGTFRIISVIALLSWPQVARVMRGEVMRIKALDFVDAARCLGMHEQAILWGEIVPNALSPVIALATLVVGQAILLEAALSFFGLTSPDVPSWGLLLHSGQSFFYQAWWLSVFPGIAVLVTVLGFNLLGDCFAQAFNPRSKEAS